MTIFVDTIRFRNASNCKITSNSEKHPVCDVMHKIYHTDLAALPTLYEVLGGDSDGGARGANGLPEFRRTRLESDVQHHRRQQTTAHDVVKHAVRKY
jgi:hypothetical protein